MLRKRMAPVFSDSDTYSASRPLLSVRGLTVSYRLRGAQLFSVRSSKPTRTKVTPALTDISLDLPPAGAFGILGESGCGKSTLLLSIANLLRRNAITEGAVLFRGRNLLAESEQFLQTIRGVQIGMVVQEAGLALNPVRRIGQQLVDVLRSHTKMSRRAYHEAAFAALQRVGLVEKGMFNSWPHQLSGGQRQRVLLAQTLLCGGPMLMLADEPTHALDHGSRAEIVRLLQAMTTTSRMALLLASHDPVVLQALTTHLVVLYAGQVIESGSTEEVLTQPLHPYTRALVDCFPAKARSAARNLEARAAAATSWRMQTIPGAPPHTNGATKGCRFASRCTHRRHACTQEQPVLRPVNITREVRCFLYES